MIGYPLTAVPKAPVNSSALLTKNIAVTDKSTIAPGFYERYSLKAAKPAASIVSTAKTPTELAITPVSYTSAANTSGLKAQIGVSFSDAYKQGLQLPTVVSQEDNNLPEAKYIHDVIALENTDLLADGTAKVPWYHYSGEGITGYLVYRAYVDSKTTAQITTMSQESMIESFNWKLVGQNIQQNQFSEKVEKKTGRIYLYMVCLVPKDKTGVDMDSFTSYTPAGWLKVNWDRPADEQISYYRVYRAEVPYFKDNQNMNSLDWVMVGDKIKYSTYTEKVDQTYAHYYYFKITSVSAWGIESESSNCKYRIPATVPPQAPAMLVPFSKKAVNQINWLGVEHASKYVVFRKIIPRIKEEDLTAIRNNSVTLFDTLFSQNAVKNIYFAEPSKSKLTLLKSKTASSISSVVTVAETAKTASSVALSGKFKTLQLKDAAVVKSSIKNMSVNGKIKVYDDLVNKYGALAVSPYGSLDYSMAVALLWEKVGRNHNSAGRGFYRREDFL